MKSKTYSVFSKSLVAVIGAFALLGSVQSAFAQSAFAQSNGQFAAEPAIVQTSESVGKILLSMSLDHQLFIKAYNDYDDILGNDGVAETTYTPGFKYVGYFDTTRCYSYTGGVFTPTGSVNASGYCEDTNATSDDGGWNGNFLNWITMTRIDLIRHVLYGGYRSTDSADADGDGVTILERSYLPNDAHSFAKHYTGSDIESLTDGLPGVCNESVTGQCDGYTFCNTSKPPTGTEFSQDVNTATSPPLMRAIKGNYSLWASGERLQCLAMSEYNGLIGLNDSTGDTANVPEATGIMAFGTEPAGITNIEDFNVRVRVCNDTTVEGDNKCQAYVDGENTYYRPTGLLHKYGTNGAVEFGLLTGSYVSNKDSGVLRSNVNDFAREVNPRTGQFIKNTDAADTITNSIVGNLDAFRIIDYRFRAPDGGVSGGYFGGSGIESCNYGEFNFANGRCRNWGNPFSEILAESYRYFSGSEEASVDASAEGTDFITGISGLSVDTWPSDRDETEDLFACANLSIIGFNASTASYDNDGFYDGASSISINNLLGDSFDGDSGSVTVDALTNAVGGTTTYGEFLPGGYFVGGIDGGTVDSECNAKDVIDGESFAKVRGTCPEAPRLNGTYLGAGLAHYFHTQADKKISTYGVTLAGATPNITIKVSDSQDLILIPACRNWDDSNGSSRRSSDPGRCALVAFRAVGVPTDTSGTYMIGWEDTEQGGDYDLDLWGMLYYSYVNNVLTVDTKLIHESTGDELDFGFIVSGTKTTNDGAYYPSGTRSDEGDGSDGFNSDENTTTSWCSGQSASDDNPRCVETKETIGGKVREVQTVTISIKTTGDSSAGTFLEEPLYYAAKWGSFNDKSSGVANVPDDPSEWMVFNKVTQQYDQLSGYTKVTNPATLNDRLDEIIKSVADRPDVATATGVSLSSSTGVGLLVNSLYYPEKKSGDNAISWIGSLTGVLRDFDGFIREDVAPFNGYVDDKDWVIEYVETDGGGTVAERSTLGVSGSQLTLTEPDRVSVESVRPLWDAQQQLAAISADQSYITQRLYGELASSGRYIFAGSRAAGVVQVTETVDFISTDPALSQFSNLLATSLDEAQLVNYIRGVDYDDMRSRTLDGTKYLLGDMVNSTPKVVSSPSAEYDSRKNDEHYIQYREQYKNRRQVVYVGANDGMLHAFNAGFANTKSVGFNTGGDGVTKHPLGSELWSYVPYNLLPHLQWLAAEDYEHVFYMDGDIQEFDVNIFKSDEDHPGGWGTIIVAGMRLGGGVFDVDGETLQSAYVIMDVTNPEVPPTLIAEVSSDDLGFTAANVELMVNRTPRPRDYSSTGDEKTYTLADLQGLSAQDILGASENEIDQLVSIVDDATEEELAGVPSFVTSLIQQSGSSSSRVNDWYLVFGSGPNNLGSAESSQTAKLFYLDLNTAVSLPDKADLVAIDFADSISPAMTLGFVGGLTVVDWGSDFTDDAIYFGLVENSVIPAEGDEAARAVRGRLMQATIDFTTDSVIAKPVQLLTGTQATDYPFSTKPFVVADGQGNRWVYAGTGRFYVSTDGVVDSPNAYVGLIVNKDNSNTVAYSDLFDVTDVRLYVDKADISNHVVAIVKDSDSKVLDDFDAPITMDTINTHVATDKGGWIRRFDSSTELVSEDTAFVNESLFVTSYDPAASGSTTGVCASSGSSIGYAFDMFNGLPQIRLDGLQTVGGENDQGQTEATSVLIDYNGYASGATIVDGTKTVRTIEGENDGDPDVVVINNEDGAALSKDPDLKKTGTGVGEALPGRTSWREISLDEVY